MEKPDRKIRLYIFKGRNLSIRPLIIQLKLFVFGFLHRRIYKAFQYVDDRKQFLYLFFRGSAFRDDLRYGVRQRIGIFADLRDYIRRNLDLLLSVLFLVFLIAVLFILILLLIFVFLLRVVIGFLLEIVVVLFLRVGVQVDIVVVFLL